MAIGFSFFLSKYIFQALLARALSLSSNFSIYLFICLSINVYVCTCVSVCAYEIFIDVYVYLIFKKSMNLLEFFSGVFREVVCSMPTYLFVLCAFPVSITHDDWCWKNKSLEVEVLEEDVSAIEFRQTGYMLRCSLSHAITLVCMASEHPLFWKGTCLFKSKKD